MRYQTIKPIQDGSFLFLRNFFSIRNDIFCRFISHLNFFRSKTIYWDGLIKESLATTSRYWTSFMLEITKCKMQNAWLAWYMAYTSGKLLFSSYNPLAPAHPHPYQITNASRVCLLLTSFFVLFLWIDFIETNVKTTKQYNLFFFCFILFRRKFGFRYIPWLFFLLLLVSRFPGFSFFLLFLN